MRRQRRRILLTIGCFVGAILLLMTLDYLGEGDLGEDEGGDTLSSMRFLSLFFSRRDHPGVSKDNDITCYFFQRWRPEEPLSQPELDTRQCQKRMPHGLVIGVKKGGTTAMARYLGLHPKVSFSRSVQPGPDITDATMVEWKETFRLTSAYQMPVTGYPGLFSGMQPQLLQMLRKHLPADIKLILMLRDPVERLVSDFVHTATIADRYQGEERKKFEELEGFKGTLHATVLDDLGHVNPFASIVRLGMYAMDLRALYQQIPEERVLIVDGNEFKKDPFPILIKVERFLELPPFFKRDHFQYNTNKHFYCANIESRPDVKCLNSQKGRKHPKISDAVIEKLYDFYRPRNQELKSDFGLNFSWIDL
nr:heparan sulfate glucosamine 3-O-sulfotransferase 1-like [Lytechinus pictus]